MTKKYIYLLIDISFHFLHRQTEVNVEYCYRLLIAQLDKYHSEIRYSTVQIIDQLFNRSHHFRNLLLADFNYLIDKCLGNFIEIHKFILFFIFFIIKD